MVCFFALTWASSGNRKKRSHQLRYVLRNKTTKDVYLVVLFTLYLKEDVNEDGSLKPEAAEAYTKSGKGKFDGHSIEHGGDGHHDDDAAFDGESALETARKHLSSEHLSTPPKQKLEDTNADDVD